MLPSTVLAAISLTVTFDCILRFVGKCVRRGSTVVLSREMGKGNIEDINAIGSSSLVFMGIVGTIMAAILLAFPDRVAVLAGAVPGSDGFSDVTSYFRGYIWKPIFSMFTGYLLTILQLKGKASSILITTSELFVGNLTCSLLNALCFGATSFGAGLAQSCAQLIPLIHLLVICVRDRSILSPSLNAFSIKVLGRILCIGAPLSAISFFLGFRSTVMNHIICDYGGIEALSAKTVYSTIISFSDVFVNAVPAVALIIAGIFAGERNKEELIDLFYRSLKLTILFSVVDMVLVFLLAGSLSEQLSPDPLVSMYASRFMRISILSAVFEGVVVLIMNFYIALKQHRLISIINIFHCVLFHIIFSILLSRFIGVYGVFASYLATEITTLAVIIILSCWKNKGLSKLSDLLPIDKEMGLQPHITKNISCIEDVHAFIMEVQRFCNENSIDKKTGFILQLCCEEMISNVFEHSFTKRPNIKGYIHVHIDYDRNKNIVLIIRDNGLLFNPGAEEITVYPEQPEKNIGIRLVRKISDEFVWQNIIGMNTLIIKIGHANPVSARGGSN